MAVEHPGQDALPGMPPALFTASPSKLTAYLDCPLRYRFAYVDRPGPAKRAQRAHTSLGQAVHNALRDWWDLPPAERTPLQGARLLDRGWVSLGFRDADQSRAWRATAAREVAAYLEGVDPTREPAGIERTVSFVTGSVALTGRIDRLDDRGELVVVDYKTSRRGLSSDEPRVSLALALYAAATWKMFRRRCVRVELHHVPTGQVHAHEHDDAGIARQVERAVGIAEEIRAAERHWREGDTEVFPAHTGPLCRWCDYRAHCPAGQAEGPEMSDWAALEPEGPSGAGGEALEGED